MHNYIHDGKHTVIFFCCCCCWKTNNKERHNRPIQFFFFFRWFSSHCVFVFLLFRRCFHWKMIKLAAWSMFVYISNINWTKWLHGHWPLLLCLHTTLKKKWAKLIEKHTWKITKMKHMSINYNRKNEKKKPLKELKPCTQ